MDILKSVNVILDKIVNMYDKYHANRMEFESRVLEVMEQEAYKETLKLRRAQVDTLCRFKVSDIDLEVEDSVLNALYHERNWFADRCTKLERRLGI
tara:strand:+ start:792 stop:1079 length:288 start_codon:yes stop_codon:yes gene_type:complete